MADPQERTGFRLFRFGLYGSLLAMATALTSHWAGAPMVTLAALVAGVITSGAFALSFWMEPDKWPTK